MMTIRFVKRCLLTCLLLSGSAAASGLTTCRVLDPELAASYRGLCDSHGLADGTGMAEGIAQYTGQFRAGRKHGRGIKLWPSGDRYEGQFVDDYRDGEGWYSWGAQSANAGDSYRGQYQRDRRHGVGIYQWASGERYEGPWENDVMRGPPTAMAIQRGRHQKAVSAAVMQINATVCREFATITGRDWMRGVVEQVDLPAMTISVKLYPVSPRPERLPGAFLASEMAVEWELCQ